MAESTSPKKPAEEQLFRRGRATRSSGWTANANRGAPMPSSTMTSWKRRLPWSRRHSRLRPRSRSRSRPPATVAPPAPAPAKPKRSLTRPVLFALLPVALVVGGYYYVIGGQVMTTDNAYIQAQSLGVSTDVSGTVQRDRRAREPGGEEGRRALPPAAGLFRDRARRRPGPARDRAQPGADAAGELPAVAGADRTGAGRHSLLRGRLPAAAGPAQDLHRLQGDFRQRPARPRRRAPESVRRQGAGAGHACPARRRRQPAGGEEPVLPAGPVGRRRRAAQPQRLRRQGAVRRHRHQCRRASGRQVSAGFAAGLQPGFVDRSVDRGGAEGNRADLCPAGTDGDDQRRHLSGRRLARHGCQRSAPPRRRASRCCRRRTPPATGSRSCSASRCA